MPVFGLPTPLTPSSPRVLNDGKKNLVATSFINQYLCQIKIPPKALGTVSLKRNKKP